MIRLQLILAFFLFTCLQNGIAQVQLAPVFTDNMVLKQNSPVAVWGTAQPNSVVRVQPGWTSETFETKCNGEGAFRLHIPTAAAGGPHTISFVNNGHEKRLTNVLLGEVWFCSGQSNMVMALKGRANEPILNSEKIIAGAQNAHIRIFTVERALALEEKKEAGGTWQVSTPEVAANTSAVAWQFAAKLQEELNVPIGIIVSAWGGTPIQGWMSSESLARVPAISLKPTDTLVSSTPGALFNGMVAPFAPFTLSGFLWYQGENDHRQPEAYAQMMPLMVEGWREKFNGKQLPFYYVQIAPWLYEKDGSRDGARFREMQFALSRKIPGSGIAVTTDVGSDKTIHPANKTAVADRLARLALAKTYGKPVPYAGPEFESMRVIDGKAILKFTHAEGLHLKEGPQNFVVAGKDRVFHVAHARVKDGHVEVWADEVANPVAVRYAYENFSDGNLFNAHGLPASTFRTDDWAVGREGQN